MISYKFLLASIILIPLICTFAIYFIKNNNEIKSLNALNVSYLSSIICLIFSIFMFISFNQKIEKIKLFGFFFGIDNLSLFFTLLINLIVFISIVSIRKRSISFPKESMGLLLILNTFMIISVNIFDILGFFTALSACFFITFLITSIRKHHQQKLNIHRFLIIHLISIISSLFAVTLIYQRCKGTGYYDIRPCLFSENERIFLFLSLSFPLVSMMMIFPFHFWYSTINNLMTTCFRITLTCFVAIASYGFLRWVFVVCPVTFEKFSLPMQTLGALSFVFSASCIIYQKNLIKKINYISIATSSYIFISIFTNQKDHSATYMVLLSYCFEIIMLIEFASIIKNRFKTLNMNALSGIKFIIPKLNMFFIPLMFTIISIPLSIGFLGKFLTIKNLIKNNITILILIVIGIILIVMSIIEIYRKIFLGKPMKEGVSYDLKINETTIFIISLSIIYFIGIFPYILIDKMG